MRPLTLMGEFPHSIPALADAKINAGYLQRFHSVTMPVRPGTRPGGVLALVGGRDGSLTTAAVTAW
jgi:hypothetical protein